MKTTAKNSIFWIGHPDGITIEQLEVLSTTRMTVRLHPEAKKRIEVGQAFLQSRLNENHVDYGINTGFGLLSQVQVAKSDLAQLQLNIIRSHAVGVGESIDDAEVRVMLALRAHTLCKGHSGVQVSTVEQLIRFLNLGIIPEVPAQGSVGASGDLAPLSHLALPLVGEGRVRFFGSKEGSKGAMSGRAALRKKGIKPIKLGPKEGLALINGTQFMTAFGILNLMAAERLARSSEVIAALSLEALRGTQAAFDSKIHALRPHAGQIAVAERMRNLLGQSPSEIAQSHADCDRVQDPYSLRCIPQVHGASVDALAWVRRVLEVEINSVTDNPLLFPETNQIISGGNFHGQYVAMAMDFLAIAVAELASISEQRIEKLMNPSFSKLPAFLTPSPGLNSGLMIVQVTAAALVSENKGLCHPACVDSIPNQADKEDHVSMGAWGARKARQVVRNSEIVLALELLSASQGIYLLRPLRSTRVLEKILKLFQAKIPYIREDREFSPDIQEAIQFVREVLPSLCRSTEKPSLPAPQKGESAEPNAKAESKARRDRILAQKPRKTSPKQK